MFNMKHLALADLTFLLMLILQIGNCTYINGASEISSWRAKLCYKGQNAIFKMY